MTELEVRGLADLNWLDAADGSADRTDGMGLISANPRRRRRAYIIGCLLFLAWMVAVFLLKTRIDTYSWATAAGVGLGLVLPIFAIAFAMYRMFMFEQRALRSPRRPGLRRETIYDRRSDRRFEDIE